MYNLKESIQYNTKLFLKSPKAFFTRLFLCIIPRNIFGIKKDIHTKGLQHNITLPNNHYIYCVLIETFVRKLFSEMKGLKKVLDIGGFIGESAIYLSNYNDEVYTYELSPTNYTYLEKNCKGIKNIHYFNGCISNYTDEYIYFSDTGDVSSVNKKEQEEGNRIKIKNYNIVDLLKNNNFDGIKIDIEGGEYDILKPILNENLFTFKMGFIEFHELQKQENMEYFKRFYSSLDELGYKIKLYNNEKINIQMNSNLNFCNLYFEK